MIYNFRETEPNLHSGLNLNKGGVRPDCLMCVGGSIIKQLFLPRSLTHVVLKKGHFNTPREAL